MNSVVSGRGGGVSRHLARGDVHTSHRDAAARGPQRRGIKPQGYPSARPQTRLPSDTPSASRGERRASVARRGAATAGGGGGILETSRCPWPEALRWPLHVCLLQRKCGCEAGPTRVPSSVCARAPKPVHRGTDESGVSTRRFPLGTKGCARRASEC